MTPLRATLSLLVLMPMIACEGDQAQLARDAGLDTSRDAVVDGSPDIDNDGDGYAADVDCNDDNPAIHPEAVEACNAVDDDCDNDIDEGSLATFNNGSTTTAVTAFASATEAAPVAYTPPGAGTLELCRGTYYTHITATANLEIVGNAAASTILHGGLAGTVLTVSGARTYRLEKLQITKGTPAATGGGGISCTGATLELVDVTLAANEAAGMNGGGALLTNCTTTFTSSTVAGNTAGQGAGVFVSGGTATLAGTRVSENTATTAGGGIYVVGTGNMLRLDVNAGSVVTGNTSSNAQGGGIHVAGGAACTNAEVTANLGHGVFVASGSYASTTCDYGTTATTDNTPTDVFPERAPIGGSNFGNDATFTCSDLVCN